MNSTLQANDYMQRIYQSLQYIEQYCDQDITLADLANAAHFSPFHFHRIFTTLLDETPADCIRRIRLEKAANLLFQKEHTIWDIALQCGFKSQALFARAFKTHFGMSATQWRKGDFWQYNGIGWRWDQDTQNSKQCKTEQVLPSLELIQQRYQLMEKIWKGECPSQIRSIKITHMPALRRVYLWQLGSSEVAMLQLWQKTLQWAEKRGLLHDEAMGISCTKDNPNITESTRCRYEAGMLVDSEFKAKRGELAETIPGGCYLNIDFMGELRDEKFVYEYLFGYWLKKNNREIDDRLGFALVPISNASGVQDIKRQYSYQLCLPLKE